ncbi:maleylpyruvate isomerase N-terminal domain-containing protein [Nonomuraea sp. NPDC047897]|uniref:maleylpyruvate isomerase N-terminal domain-containing protein n=1 Tax=Nonomuraea sp. NPDC047897 TaxID=3364346 RepID=UPI00370FC7EA
MSDASDAIPAHGLSAVPTPWAELPTEAAAHVLPLMEKGLDQDWSRPAGETDWSLRELIDHITLGVMGYAGLLVARPADRYIALRTGNDPHAPVAECLESITIAATLLSHTVRATGPEVRAHHPWGTSDRTGFAAMGAVEILVHAHDMTRTLGFDWTPPDDLAEPVVERLFPAAPAGHAPGRTLLWACGRVALPGLPRLPRGGWQWSGEVR